MIRKVLEAAGVLLVSAGAALAATSVDNDYPTSARVDYVIACMAANGQTREAMTRCSCSVDTLASILPYDRYVAAETILSMRQGVGQAASIFRNTPQYEDNIAELRRAQAEAEVRCFK
ncbi:hypothetical protein V5F34_13250 [Xanthobacter autotrophicus]|jgi:hypothetical protein|uniref:Rap1a immunity protein domain-containing protein n=1 Tax=Xanthobacter autotrophicus TaxID=280 RepID=Q7BQP8_XANAU|nr:hypothetical protein [Xanthobacter autotrophicus]AAS17987.1 conserved hypothetical protein [Xanthobacter autotrophicus]TLX41847.1 hypothetical protein FBQ73_17190 [Xanthobacter autotrophicus]